MRAWKVAVLIAVIGLAGWSAERSAGTFTPQAAVPTDKVRRGNLKLDVRTTGELQTTRNVTLFAPTASGGTLQIVRLDADGTAVKPGELVLEFDPSEQEYDLETNRSDLEEAEQEIAAAKDQAAVQNSDDRLALLKAKYAVRDAELQVQKNPLLATIDAKKNILALDEAKRTLAQLEQDIQSHASSDQAALAVAQAKYNKAQIAMQRAEHNIKNMTIRAPIAGVVKVRQNFRATGGFFFTGMSIPEFRNGDQAEPGTPVADILDMNGMEIMAKVSETDRPSVRVGEPAEIRVDSIPNVVFAGKVKTIAGMALKSIWEASPTGKFNLSVEFDHPDPRLRPGSTAHLTLVGDQLKDVLYVPRVAVFEKNGNPVVYLKSHGGFEARGVKLKTETAAWAVIQGLASGDEVALANPVAGAATNPSAPAGSAIQGTGK